MTPREREAWLAEHLLGWKCVTPEQLGWSRRETDPDLWWQHPGGALMRDPPDLSSWAGLGLVVEAMAARGFQTWEIYRWRVRDEDGSESFVYGAEFGAAKDEGVTPEDAVLCAAIYALGGTP